MRTLRLSKRLTQYILLLPLFLLAACSGSLVGMSTTSGAPGVTLNGLAKPPAGPDACVPRSVSSYTLVWVQPYTVDRVTSPQIWMSVNGSPQHVVTHLAGSNLNPQLASATFIGPPLLSPDARHVVFSFIVKRANTFQQSGAIYIADMANGDAKQIPSSLAFASDHAYAWLNNHEVLVAAQSGLETYDLATRTVLPLPNVPFDPSMDTVHDIVVRGSHAWFNISRYDISGLGTDTLYQYDLNAHSILARITLGTTNDQLPALTPFVHYQGWDISPDGQHLVYQFTTAPSGSPADRVGKSIIYYANSDGSDATPILRRIVTANVVRLSISPNGLWVAVTEATPAATDVSSPHVDPTWSADLATPTPIDHTPPNVFSGRVDRPSADNDPTFSAYMSNATDQPAWDPDGCSFLATTRYGVTRFDLNAPADRSGVLLNGNTREARAFFA